jgi:hypothetical protein
LTISRHASTRGGFLFYARTTYHAPEAIKKMRSRGGFQAAFPLTPMNRHKQQTRRKKLKQENQNLEKRNPCKLNNQ